MSEENKNSKSSTNILKKIMAAIRTESRELTDAVKGTFGSAKVEQDFESAQYKLKEAKLELTKMMGKHQQANRVIEITNEKIHHHETLIVDALDQNDKQAAMKNALEVVDLEHSRAIQVESLSSISTNIEFLQEQLEQSERELKEFSRQLSMLKTTEKVQKATEAIIGNIDGADANLMSAKKSFDRIREKQKNKDSDKIIAQQMVKDYNRINNDNNEINEVLDNPRNSAQQIINRIQDKR